MKMKYLIPFLLAFLPIFMINWCARKPEEYPDIKLDTKLKKFCCYIITLSFLETTTALFDILKSNIVELYFIWAILLLLIAVSYIDWKTSLIPNRYSYSLLALGFVSLIYNIITKDTIFIDHNAQLIAFGIIAVSFILLYFISKNGIGMGDVKIVTGMSMFLGISLTALMLFFSSFGILTYNLIIKLLFKKQVQDLPNNELYLDTDYDTVNGRVMGLSKINNHTAIVMGPFLAISFVITYLVGNNLLSWWFFT